MRFGLQINPYAPGPTGNPWDAAVARVAEDGGFDSPWLYDHFMFEAGPLRVRPEPVLECFVGLAALAPITAVPWQLVLAAIVVVLTAALAVLALAALDPFNPNSAWIGAAGGVVGVVS